MKNYTFMNKTGVPGLRMKVVEGLDGTTIEVVRGSLRDVPKGSVVKIGEYEYTVLDHGSETTALLANENIRYMHFGLTSNYANSDVRKFLRGEFEDKLAKAVGANNIVDRHLSVVAEDGTTYAERCHERVGLLTAELYRRYRRFIKPLRSEWWLATPHSTTQLYFRLVKAVYSDGALCSVNASTASCGVRPYVVLNSGVTNFELVE